MQASVYAWKYVCVCDSKKGRDHGVVHFAWRRRQSSREAVIPFCSHQSPPLQFRRLSSLPIFPNAFRFFLSSCLHTLSISSFESSTFPFSSNYWKYQILDSVLPVLRGRLILSFRTQPKQFRYGETCGGCSSVIFKINTNKEINK